MGSGQDLVDLFMKAQVNKAIKNTWRIDRRRHRLQKVSKIDRRTVYDMLRPLKKTV